MFFITWLRNLLSPIEWTVLALIVFLGLIGMISFIDGVLLCGSEGWGPAAESNC